MHGNCADRIVESWRALPAWIDAQASRLTTADLLESLESDVRASRLRCVSLPLTVLQSALEGKEVAR